jgi:hypothetical protein
MDERELRGETDRRPPSLRGSAPEGLDRDIRVRRIVRSALGVVVLIAIAAAASALFFFRLRDELRRADPPPPLLPEARAPEVPPGPHLQASPARDMAAYLARERAVMESYGWSDEAAGTARIPIDRAIDLYVDAGLRPALAGEPPPDGGAP